MCELCAYNQVTDDDVADLWMSATSSVTCISKFL